MDAVSGVLFTALPSALPSALPTIIPSSRPHDLTNTHAQIYFNSTPSYSISCYAHTVPNLPHIYAPPPPPPIRPSPTTHQYATSRFPSPMLSHAIPPLPLSPHTIPFPIHASSAQIHPSTYLHTTTSATDTSQPNDAPIRHFPLSISFRGSTLRLPSRRRGARCEARDACIFNQ